MIAEAGGQVTMPDGLPLDLYARKIVASNRLIHDEMVQMLANSRSGGHRDPADPRACSQWRCMTYWNEKIKKYRPKPARVVASSDSLVGHWKSSTSAV